MAPVYNEGAYVEQFVSENINELNELGQTKNAEIILINDGSTDNTEKYLMI